MYGCGRLKSASKYKDRGRSGMERPRKNGKTKDTSSFKWTELKICWLCFWWQIHITIGHILSHLNLFSFFFILLTIWRGMSSKEFCKSSRLIITLFGISTLPFPSSDVSWPRCESGGLHIYVTYCKTMIFRGISKCLLGKTGNCIIVYR